MPIKSQTGRVAHFIAILLAGVATGTSFARAPGVKPETVPQGVVKAVRFPRASFSREPSADVAVFIPAQYDGSKPACVYVKTDGYNPVEKTLLETLIATKEMPVTIGVFVTPGRSAARR